jgi:hypothetical protein
MPNIKSLATILFALLIAAPACGGGGDCEKAYDMAKKCAKGDQMGKLGKEEFVSFCEKAKADPKMKEEVEADLACAKEDSCEKAKACADAQRGKRRAKKITESITAGKWKDAFDDCTLSEAAFADETYKAECNKVFANVDKITGDDLAKTMFRCKSSDEIKKVAPDFEKACKTLAAGNLAAAQKAGTAARDAGKNDIRACMDLKDTAAQAGGDAVTAAQKLCAEMDVAEDAKKAVDEARANAAAKKANLPYQCDSSAEKLAKIESEWAKKTVDDVLKACYVELGAVVIQEKGKDAKYFCPHEIKKIQEAAGKHDLATKFPELAEAMKKLPAKCQEKDAKDAKDAKK